MRPAARSPHPARPAPARLIVELAPRGLYRLPGRGGPDGVSRVRAGVYERLLRVDGLPIVARAWERERRVVIAAVAAEPGWLTSGPAADADAVAGPEQLEVAVARVRHALCIDDDLSGFFAAFKGDRLLAPAIRRRPWLRARRCPWPWEALAWAVTEQLIETERAASIQRRIVARWGSIAELPPDGRRLWDVPAAAEIAGRAPAELAALDLAPKRALALISAAREVASGRCDPERAEDDRRLLAIPEIGPWTVQCLGLKGRGDPDSLPAGDLAYIKLVGRLAGMDRRATVEEVEEFYAPYAPYRGWTGLFTLAHYGHLVKEGGSQRLAPDLGAAA